MRRSFTTEAERRRTPAPPPAQGLRVQREGAGQRASRERGAATRSKKSPGKRAHQGGH